MSGRASLRRRIALATALIVVAAGLAGTGFVALELREIAQGEAPGPGASEYMELAQVLLPFAVLAPVAGWLAASWSLKPLAVTAQEAAQIGPDNPHLRLTADGMPDEVAPLIEAVNAALDRLRDALQREQQLSADTAHALRNPITTLQLRLQQTKADDEIDRDALRADAERIRRAVEQLLVLAGLDRPSTEVASVQTVELGRVVRSAAAALLPQADALGREIVVNAPEPVRARVDAPQVEEAMSNLIHNALIHGDGRVEVTLSASETEAVIGVSDEGHGVPAGTRERLLQRFAKGSTSNGSGLGLAIAAMICRNAGGTLRWPEASTLEIRLPKGR